jgi:hypothetical protein
MTIAMSEQVDAEPCDVLRGGDGPVYFLLGGQLYVVHEILGRWIEPETDPRRRTSRRVVSQGGPDAERKAAREAAGGADAEAGPGGVEGEMSEPAQVEHWLVVASVGRFGTPSVFRLQRRPAPPANGPDYWTARAERR